MNKKIKSYKKIKIIPLGLIILRFSKINKI